MHNALLITAIGMGLVFIAMLALWALMELSVRLTARYAENEGEEEEAEESGSPQEEPAGADAGLAKKRRAAVAAVAYALAQTKTLESPESTAMVAPRRQAYAWQAVLRASQLNQQSNLYDRKAGRK
jgi:Na+-transporting methylmalonyl-CoA/oxaloacetate decarboxylase gamma subunit